MKQEDKELLLKDLCSRLPYGVIGQCEIDASYDTSFDTIFQTHKFNAIVYGLKEDLLLVTPLIEDQDEQEFANEEIADGVDILDFKPYLFPLSSMTEEQKKELENMDWSIDDSVINNIIECLGNHRQFVTHFNCLALIEWCYKNHFDINGLISIGSAIDATGLNIYKNG